MPKRSRSSRFLAAAGVVVVLCAATAPATADVASAERWDPLAAAHLYAVFTSRLEPIDWEGIAARYGSVSPIFPHSGTEPALDRLAALAGGAPVLAIREAIARRDPAALRRASERALARAVGARLAEAGRAGDRPAVALRRVLAARAAYRGLEIGLRRQDPAAHGRIGRAWLALTTRIGAGEVAVAAAAGRLAETLAARFGAGDTALPPPQAWLPPDAVVGEQTPLPRLVLNFEERGIDEKRLFMVAYGDMLFDSPLLFGAPARALRLACSSCHNRGHNNRAFYVPGLSRRPGGVDVDNGFFNPLANDLRFDPLDIPSLRGVRFTAPYGRDGRTASLREFTRNAIVNEFAGPEPSPLMLDALVAYMNEFDFLPAPLLYRDGRLNARASAAAKRGEAIFNRPFALMGGRSCAGCHIPDANFLDGRRHDIGSVAASSAHARDGALDTPTLLGIAYSAPYFHDGSLPDLEAVVDWFDRRYAMGLTAGEAADLAAYLAAVGGGERPFESFDAEATRFALGFAEASTFLATLDRLIPARDRRHALLLLETVGADLRADALALARPASRAPVMALAARIDAIAAAIAGGDWSAASGLWAGYKRAEVRHAGDIR